MNGYKRINSGSGVDGGEYEIKLMILYILRAYQSSENHFQLYHGSQRYLKLDDIILKTDNHTILAQAKHKKTGKISDDDFFGNKKDFNFLVYLETFKHIFFQDLKEVEEKSKELEPLVSQIREAFENGDDSYQSYFRKLISKLKDQTIINLLTSFQRTEMHLITNLPPTKKLNIYKKENYYSFNNSGFIKQFCSKIIQQKKKIPSIFVSKFLENFQLHVIDESFLERTTYDILEKIKMCDVENKKLNYFFLYEKLKKWSQNHTAGDLTRLDVEAYFTEFHNGKFIKELKKFENDIDFDIPFQLLPTRNLNSKESPTVTDMVTLVETPRYFLIMTKLQQNWSEELSREQVLFVNPLSKLEIQICAVLSFRHRKYTHMFCSLVECNQRLKKTIKKVYLQIQEDERMKKYKKIVIFFETGINFTISKDERKINDDNWYDRLELKMSSWDPSDYEKFYVSRILREFKISIDDDFSSISPDSSNFTFRNNVKKEFSEDEFLEKVINDESDIFILSSSPGMGKTFLLNSLSCKINKSRKLWAIRIELNRFTDLLLQYSKSGTILEIKDFLESIQLDLFHKQVSTISRAVILLVDAVDEVSPDFFEVVLNFLKNALAKVKKTILTTRDNLRKQLEDQLNGVSYMIQKLASTDISELICRVSNNSEISREYIKNMNSDLEDFLGTPLHTKIFAECYCQQDMSSSMDSCMSLGRLYDSFLREKKLIFMNEKSRYTGNISQREALEREFEQHLQMCTKIAIEVFFNKKQLAELGVAKSHESILDEKFYRVGILKYSPTNDCRMFIHRTFIEYFVARFFMKVIQKMEHFKPKKLKIIFRYIYSPTFQFDIVRKFIEYGLKNNWESISQDICTDPKGRLLKLIPTNSKYWQHLVLDCHTHILMLMLVNDLKLHILNAIFKEFLNTAPLSFFQRADILWHLIDKGVDVNSATYTGTTVLHYASISGNFRLVKMLMNKMIDLNARDDKGFTSLDMAIAGNHPGIVQLLIERGAIVYSSCEYGCSDSDIAEDRNYIAILRHLIENNDRVSMVNDFVEFGVPKSTKLRNTSPLHTATICGYLDIFQIIYSVTKNIEFFDNGITLLHVAAESGNLELVQYLLSESMCDLPVLTSSGWSVLGCAARSGNLELVKYLVYLDTLILGGSNINYFTVNCGARSGNLDIVKYFVDLNVEVKERSSDGYTTLHSAAASGNLELVKYLVDLNVKIEAKTMEHETVLHFAAKSGNVELMKFLLDLNVSFSGKTYDGWTVLHCAVQSGNLELVRYLVTLDGIDPHEKTYDDWNVMHFAVQSGNLELVKYFQHLGVDMNEKTSKGESSCDIALRYRHIHIVKHLANAILSKIPREGKKSGLLRLRNAFI